MAFDQDAEQVERPPAYRHWRQNTVLVSTEQTASIEMEPLEQEGAAQGERAHASAFATEDGTQPNGAPSEDRILTEAES